MWKNFWMQDLWFKPRSAPMKMRVSESMKRVLGMGALF